jgi:hypothetical protein
MTWLGTPCVGGTSRRLDGTIYHELVAMVKLSRNTWIDKIDDAVRFLKEVNLLIEKLRCNLVEGEVKET